MGSNVTTDLKNIYIKSPLNLCAIRTQAREIHGTGSILDKARSGRKKVSAENVDDYRIRRFSCN